jgi:hypothetical protein
VVVIEDHGDLAREIGEFVDEGTEHRLHPRRLGRAKRGEDTFAEVLPSSYGPPERGDEIREEPDRIVVSFVQRHPGDGAPAESAAYSPLAQEGGLTETCGSRDQRQLATGLSLESGSQPRPRDQLRARLGGSQLGGH